MLFSFSTLFLSASCGTEQNSHALKPVQANDRTSVTAYQAVGSPSINKMAKQPTTTLIIEAWNARSRPVWESKILHHFDRLDDSLEVLYQPTESAAYDVQLQARLDGQSAGDIITCRPFDRSLELYEHGALLDLTEVVDSSFDPRAQRAWSTDDNRTTFCLPVSSVTHGFYYNVDIFAELGVTVPETLDQMVEVMVAISVDGRYTPLALGTKDRLRPGEVGFTTLGPALWEGEQGRQQLVAGEINFLDQRFIEVFDELARWRPFLPEASEFVTNDDAREMFRRGEAAIYPGESWELKEWDTVNGFEVGVFKPPVRHRGQRCAVIDHPYLGLGINQASPEPDAALAFIRWAATPEFGELVAESLPGHFPLNRLSQPDYHPLAAEFDSWRHECDQTIRLTAQFLERGPNRAIEHVIGEASTAVLEGEMTSARATNVLHDAMTGRYPPGDQ